MALKKTKDTVSRSEFEQLALTRIGEVITDLQPLLRAQGLSSPGPILGEELWEDLDQREVSIWVYRNTEVVDVIEFFIWIDGEPSAPLEELVEYVRTSIAETLEDEGA